ncbi:TonB-dependent receptor [Bacteroidia bacterium]|nr:TonB-dependent receptor [Bacteroidia bacterium]
MKKNGLLVLFAFFALGSYANDIITEVKGQVMDSVAQETIPYATVTIVRAENPAEVIKGLVTDDDGNFKVSIDKAGDYLLTVSFIGKKTVSLPFKAGEETTVDLQQIALSDDTNVLGEVTVVGQKPLVKVDIDKITYSMEDDPESKTNSTLEMLKKVPMVTVDGDENVQLKGSSNFKFYMNGKPSTLISSNPKDVLKSIPANTIKRIEVITDPGAKYDAEGVAGIINIVTQSALGGYTVSLNAGGNTLGGLNGGTYFTVKYGKVGFTGMYNLFTYNSPAGENRSIRTNFLDDNMKYMHQDGTMKYDGRGQFGYGELSYEIDTFNLVTLSFNRYAGSFDLDMKTTTELQNAAEQTVFKYREERYNPIGQANTTIDANYQRIFPVPDRLLTISYRLNLTPNDNSSENEVTNIENFVNRNNKQFTNADDKEHTFQLDFTTPFNKIHSLETGVKYILRDSRSESGHSMLGDDGNWLNMPSDWDDFKNRQDILAAYIGYSLKYKKWGVKTGLRYEATFLEASYKLNNSMNFKKDYQNMVPSVAVSYQIKPLQTLRLSYNMHISRPGISYLNPYVNSSDTSYINYGNPNLNAVQNNSISLNYNFFNPKFNMNADLSYNFANNEIDNYTWIDNAISYTTYDNISQSKKLNLSLYLNWTLNPKLRIYSNLGGRYVDLRSNKRYLELSNSSTSVTNHGFEGNAFYGIQYTAPWKLITNINGGNYSPNIGLQRKGTGFFYYVLSIGKNLLNDKLNLRAYIVNAFHDKMTFENNQWTPDYSYDSWNTQSRRNIGFSVSYRFGEMKQQIKKTQRKIENNDKMSIDQGGGGDGGASM